MKPIVGLVAATLLAVSAGAQGVARELVISANQQGNSVTIVDAATMEKLATVPVGVNPHETAVTPDGKLAYVTLYGGSFGNEISVIDLETFRELKRINLGQLTAPHGIVHAAGKIWFTAERSSSVARYDPGRDVVDWVGSTGAQGSHMLAVRRDGSTVYAVNIANGTVSVIPVNGSASQVSMQVAVVNQPEGIALSPDESQLWVGSRQPFGLSVIDTATNAVIATREQGTTNYRVAFTPDGRYAVTPRDVRVIVFDPVTRNVVRQINAGGLVLSVVFAPDSRRLFVAAAQPDRILRIDIETGEITGTVASGPFPDGIAFATQYSDSPAPRRRSVRR